MPGHTIAAVDDSADDIVTYPSAKPAVSTPQELSTVPPPLTANRSENILNYIFQVFIFLFVPTGPCVVRQLTEKGEEITVDSHGIKLTRFPPHDSAKLCTAVEYSFGTVQVEDRSVERVLEAYKMKSWPHGVCAIVNNEMFSSHTKRVGTDIDEANLTQCFRLLGYSVEVYRNLTAHQIESVFSYYRMCNHSKFDSFIVCILSHGEEGHVFGTDSKSVNLRSIVGQLNADSCQSLAGKPKIFFIQACRGHDKVMGREIASDSGSVELPTPPVAESVRVVDDSTPVSIPQDADFYFGNATPPGKVAWRDMDHGSWYVSEICRVFSSLARYVDLDSMVTRVHDEVGTGYKNMNYRQAPESTTRLRKKVYFFD